MKISEKEAIDLIGKGSVAAHKAHATRRNQNVTGWIKDREGVKPSIKKKMDDELKIESELLDEDTSQETVENFTDSGRIQFVTFHPSYSYEEFIEGITVNTEQNSETDNGKICYIRKWGIFKKICTQALANGLEKEIDENDKCSWKDQWSKFYKIYKEKSKEERVKIWENADDFVLIIDEINRGDISKIFGELVTLLENDKRLGQENEVVVQLPYSNDLFGVPPNLHIIGTMNTADRSIAMVDVALRRRFGFVELPPRFDLLISEHVEKNKGKLQDNGIYKSLLDSIEVIDKKINKKIVEKLTRDKQIGHSFFFKVFTEKDLIMAWQYEILPLIEEYYYCNYNDIIQTLDIPSDNPYLNQSKGIIGFKNLQELNNFLNLISENKGP